MKPPHTYRGVDTPGKTETPPPAAGIDWLQYSVPWPSGIEEFPRDEPGIRAILTGALPPHDELYLSGEILRPLQGYSAGMGLSFGRVFWHAANKAQHIGVVFTGDDMRAAISVMLPHIKMVSWALAKAKHIARLDFALDVFDPAAEPRDLLKMWKAGEVATRAQTIMEQTRYVHTKERGIVAIPTVYIGRRDSERMLRVYDKAGELGVPGHWVRVELQTRHDQSMALARAMQGAGVAAAGRQAVRNFARAEKCEWYNLALVGPVVGMAPIRHHSTNTDKWLRMVALPALQRAATQYARDGDWSLYDMIERALSDILRDSAPGNVRGTGGSHGKP